MKQIELQKEVEVIEQVFGKDSLTSSTYKYSEGFSYVVKTTGYPTRSQQIRLNKGSNLLQITELSPTLLRVTKHFGKAE